jgi:hypothetical protein
MLVCYCCRFPNFITPNKEGKGRGERGKRVIMLSYIEFIGGISNITAVNLSPKKLEEIWCEVRYTFFDWGTYKPNIIRYYTLVGISYHIPLDWIINIYRYLFKREAS